MAQKNFDPLQDAVKMDAYKGKHCYFMSEKEAYEAANNEAKAAFDKVKNAVEKEIRSTYKGKIGTDIPEEVFAKQLAGNDKYNKALKTLRDSVISDEMAECLERALIKDRNGKIPETILKNQVQNSTKWTENAWLSNLNKSSAELYNEFHFSRTGKNISESDLIKLDFSEIGERAKNDSVSFGQKIKNFFGKKSGKITGIVAGCAVLAGAGYALYKSNQTKKPVMSENNQSVVTKPVKSNKPEEKHLSCIG
jgi:hypothetical protein